MKHYIAFVCLLFSLGLSGQDSQTVVSDYDFVPLFTSGEDNVACYRIPAIITALDGSLIAMADQRVPNCGDLRSCDDINIVMRKSKDHGKTWTPITMVIDHPKGESASDPSMILDRSDGSIYLFYNYMDLNKEKNIYYLRVMKSTDHGETWSDPIDITSQITKSEWHSDFQFITSGRGVCTSDGVLLHTLVNLQRGLFVFGSEDGGKSWKLYDTPLSPGDESKIIELANGDWMVNSRVNNAGHRQIHTSSDRGITWESRADSSLVDPGCNAGIITYNSESEEGLEFLIFSNANDPKSRQNLTLKVSTDDGKTWSTGRTIYKGKSAYSDITILEDGSLGVVFEKDGYAEITFAKISMAHLIEDDRK